jgi:hypothetical protein
VTTVVISAVVWNHPRCAWLLGNRDIIEIRREIHVEVNESSYVRNYNQHVYDQWKEAILRERYDLVFVRVLYVKEWSPRMIDDSVHVDIFLVSLCAFH